MLITLSLFLFVMVMPSALAFGWNDFWTLITDFSNGYNQYKDAYNYIALALATMAVFTVGYRGAAKWTALGEEKSRNAITVFIGVAGFLGGLGIFHQLKAINVYPLDFFGKFGAVILFLITALWLGSFFYKGEGGSSRLKYFIIA